MSAETMTLTAVIPIWGDYRRYWPRVWSEIARQANSGGGASEVIVVRPPGESKPSLASLGQAFEVASRQGAPELRECPIGSSNPRIGPVRNAALDRVSSRLVTFVDADDYLLPGIWRLLACLHQRYPALGSAAAGSLMHWPDGTITRLGSRAHRWRWPRRFRPDRGWHQALLWRLSVESALLSPGAAGVHASSVLRECGGYGRGRALEDLVLGLASLSCAPACYLPRVAGSLWEIHPGSLWSRRHPRREFLQTYDELVERLRELASKGRLRPGLARGQRLAHLFLARYRRRLSRTIPPAGLQANASPPPALTVRPHPLQRAWVAGALRDERRMAELLGLAA